MSSDRRRLTFIVITMLCTSAACGPLHRGGGPLPAAVVFVNESTDQADVFVIPASGAEVRIGTVMAARTDTLRVPTAALGGSNSVNIVARVFASSRAPRTGPVTLTAGDQLRVTLPANELTLTVLPLISTR